MLKKLFIHFLLAVLLAPTLSNVQANEKDTLNADRLETVVGVSTISYTLGLGALSALWYNNSDDFHFFNDNNQWKQVDKLGHVYGAYQLGHVGIRSLQWAGVSQKEAYFWGGMMGFLMLLPIEILDGFSAEYGASWGDLLANGLGTGLLMGQYFLWDEIRIHPKFSFYPSRLATLRPKILGEGYQEQLMKDYNGQTYWFSFDIYAFLKKGGRFPKWLNIALGYGAQDMVFGNELQNTENQHDAYRQYYLSIDIDLSHYKTKSKFLNTLLFVVNMIHLPAPALEYNRKQGFVFHPIYF